MHVALTIAGSDSGGGAGIQADLKTFQRYGVFGTSAITAITAQNTLGVAAWEPVSIALVRAQIDAVAMDLRPSAFKTGMLGSADIVRTVIAAISGHSLTNFVLDPVMVASSGDVLLDSDAVAVIRDELIPLCAVVTPNLDEAALLLGQKILDEEGMSRAAEKLVHEHGARSALVKGGHLESGEAMVDVLYDGTHHAFRAERLSSRNTHGTGCTLSASIAAQLAGGTPLLQSVIGAIQFVHNAIAAAPSLGQGTGPLNHLVPIRAAKAAHS
ncbi:MAG TPA: bifunctional hydroxymethylpyrimidine kinase/phosphomethylpyrimidine kinase [Gemmatimonadaceae bacterium]|nr:bifunctional hydroxymethylpyrimidine kinase/phosphomethylpyrimidine kinase [Gemmatimonadaceae bacterium]